MLVTLNQRIFQDPVLGSTLGLSLLLAARERQHVMLTDPVWDRAEETQPINQWLKPLPDRVAAAIRELLEASLQEAPKLGLSIRRIRVEPVNGSRWNTAILSPDDALRLMWTPLWLVLENGRTDLQFLRRILDQSDRSALDERLRDGRIEVPLGGGTGELKWFLQQLATLPLEGPAATHNTTCWIRRLRSWVMFDRDAARHDQSAPSEESETLRALCESMDRPWSFPGHQLGRRTVENYLPREALDGWAEHGSGDKRKRRREMVEAFISSRFGPLRRSCFAMKEGLLKDVSDDLRAECKRNRRRRLADAEVGSVFQGLEDPVQDDRRGLSAQEIRNRLQTGFRKDIGDLFGDTGIDDKWFWKVFSDDPGAAAWRRRIVESLWEVM